MRQVHEQVKMLQVNILHHFSEREFIPLAAAVAASFAVGGRRYRLTPLVRHATRQNIIKESCRGLLT